MTIDINPIDEPLPRYVGGLRCFAFKVCVDGVERRTELRVPPEMLIEPHWSDAIHHVTQFVQVDPGCGGCGG